MDQTVLIAGLAFVHFLLTSAVEVPVILCSHKLIARGLGHGADPGVVPSVVINLITALYTGMYIATEFDKEAELLSALLAVSRHTALLCVVPEVRVFTYHRRTPGMPVLFCGTCRLLLMTAANVFVIWTFKHNPNLR
jgi:hypothetical protein